MLVKHKHQKKIFKISSAFSVNYFLKNKNFIPQLKIEPKHSYSLEFYTTYYIETNAMEAQN